MDQICINWVIGLAVDVITLFRPPVVTSRNYINKLATITQYNFRSILSELNVGNQT